MTVGCKTPPTDSPGNSPEWIQHRWYKESVSQSVDMDCCHLWMHTMMIPLRTSVAHSLLVCWHSVQKKHLTDCRECTSSPLHQLVHMMLQKGIKHWNYWLPRMHLSARPIASRMLKHAVLHPRIRTYFFKVYKRGEFYISHDASLHFILSSFRTHVMLSVQQGRDSWTAVESDLFCR